MKNIVALLLLSSVRADSFGRDAKGEFKNQAEYIKARNDLNEAEGKNKEVFDSINNKLMDKDFVLMAAQQSE
jgi:hypothetical protein